MMMNRLLTQKISQFLLIIGCCCSFSAFGQIYETTVRDAMYTYPKTLITFEDGSIISVGVNHFYGGWGSEHLIATKFNKDGDLVWQKSYQGDFSSEVVNVSQSLASKNGGFYLLLAFEGCDYLVGPTHLAKMDSKGEIVWVKRFGNDDFFYGKRIERIGQMSDERVFAVVDGQVYILDAEATIVDSLSIAKDAEIGYAKNYENQWLLSTYESGNMTLFIQDTEGNILKSVDSLEYVRGIGTSTDFSHMALYKRNYTENLVFLESYDADFNKIAELNLDAYYARLNGIRYYDDYILMLGAKTQTEDYRYEDFYFVALDWNLNELFRLDIEPYKNGETYTAYGGFAYRVQGNLVYIQSSIDGHIFIQNYHLQEKVRHKNIDLKLAQVSINTIEKSTDSLICYGFAGEEGLYNYTLTGIELSVTNVGDETVNSFEINSDYFDYCSFICGNYQGFTQRYENLDIEPGATVFITFPDMFIANQDSTFAPCFSVTRPNDKLDKQYDNNQACYDGTTVSIQEVPVSQGVVKVYPNPAVEQLQLQLPLNWANKSYQYAIFDTKGQQILTANGQQGKDIPQINIANLPKGLYFVRIANKQSKQIIKFLKQ